MLFFKKLKSRDNDRIIMKVFEETCIGNELQGKQEEALPSLWPKPTNYGDLELLNRSIQQVELHYQYREC